MQEKRSRMKRLIPNGEGGGEGKAEEFQSSEGIDGAARRQRERERDADPSGKERSESERASKARWRKSQGTRASRVRSPSGKDPSE